MSKSEPTRHLDLGCGETPRNPYARDRLYGVDIMVPAQPGACEIRRANLSIDPIPYDDGSFDSVSAYDFFEHVPRVLATADGRSTRFPFVELMNEVWRVLRPGGYLYASMPCYPSEQAFQDPTHVNILTISSHEYFTEPALAARMYGFVGCFQAVRVLRHSPRGEYEPVRSGWRHGLRRWNRARLGNVTHLLWEFTAVK